MSQKEIEVFESIWQKIWSLLYKIIAVFHKEGVTDLDISEPTYGSDAE